MWQGQKGMTLLYADFCHSFRILCINITGDLIWKL